MRDLYNNIDHKHYLDKYLMPALKRQPAYKTLRVVYDRTWVAGSLHAIPEWICYVKGSQNKIGFDPGNVRKADNDDPERIAKFLWEAVTGVLPSFAWYNLSSLGQIFRVAQGSAAPPEPERELFHDADKKKTANDHLKVEYDQSLAFSEDIDRVSKKHDELFKAKVLGEKDRLELLGPNGETLDTLKSIREGK